MFIKSENKKSTNKTLTVTENVANITSAGLMCKPLAYLLSETSLTSGGWEETRETLLQMWQDFGAFFYLRLKHEYQHKPLPLGTQKLSMGQCGTFANLRALAGDLTKLTYPWVSTQSPGATVCNHRQEKDGGVLPINVSPMSNCQHASMDKH